MVAPGEYSFRLQKGICPQAILTLTTNHPDRRDWWFRARKSQRDRHNDEAL